MIELKTAFFYLLGTVLSIYGVGHLFYSFVTHEQPPLVRSFYKLVLGAVILLVGFATLQTNGKTLMLGTLPLLGILAMKCKLSGRYFHKNIKKVEWRLLFFFIPVIFLFLSIQYNQLSGHSIHPDSSYYASIGNYICQNNMESANTDWVNLDMQTPVPYHYGEIWLAAIIACCAGCTMLNTYMYLYTPLMMLIFYTGIAAYMQRQFNVPAYKSLAIAFLLPCIVIVPYYMLNEFSFSQGITWMGHLYIQKFLPVCITFTTCLLVDHKRIYPLVLALCILTILYTSIIPVAVAAILFYLTILAVRRRFSTDYWTGVAIVVFTILYICTFYVINIHSVLNPNIKESLTFEQAFVLEISKPGEITKVVIAIGKRLFDIFLNVCPYLTLFFLPGKEQRKELWIMLKENQFIGLVALTGIVVSGCLYFLVDSAQLMTAVSLPALLIFAFAMLAHAILRRGRKQLWLPGLLIICNIGIIVECNRKRPELDTRFLNAANYVIKQKEGNFAFVQSGRSLVATSPFLRSANYIPVLPDIRWYTDSYLPVNLSVYDIPYDLSNVQDATYVVGALENSPFLRYVEKNKLSKDLKEAQNRFLREYNIRFVVVQKGMDWFKDRPFRVEQVIPSNTENYDLYVISPK